MKKNIVLLILLTTSIIFGQRYQSSLNSSTTNLTGGSTFTGTKEKAMNYNNVYAYNWINITVKSNAGGTGKIQQSKDGTTWQNTVTFTYTAGDTLANVFSTPIILDYFRVIYTNGSTAQTSFSLTTVLTNQSIAMSSTSTGQGQSTLITASTLTGAANNQTVSTEIDSITFTGATSRVMAKVFSVNDTIEVSLKLNFSSPRIAYPFVSIDKYENINPLTFPKIYIRKYGSRARTCTYNYSWEGK